MPKSEPISDSSDDSQQGAEPAESAPQPRPIATPSPELPITIPSQKRNDAPLITPAVAPPALFRPHGPPSVTNHAIFSPKVKPQAPPQTTLVLTAADPVILRAPEKLVNTSIPIPPPLPPTPVIFTLASQPPAVKTRQLQQATVTQTSAKKKSATSASKNNASTPQQASNKNRIIKFHEYKVS